MFLQTSSTINGDYTFYHPPQLHDDSSRPAYFDALVRRLLEINPRKRLTPKQFVQSVRDRCVPINGYHRYLTPTSSVTKSFAPHARPMFNIGHNSELLHSPVPTKAATMSPSATRLAAAALWSMAALVGDFAADCNTVAFLMRHTNTAYHKNANSKPVNNYVHR
jgi:hypothetical protein